MEDSSTLPDPDVLAQEIVDDPEDALEQFTAIAGALKTKADSARPREAGPAARPRPHSK